MQKKKAASDDAFDFDDDEPAVSEDEELFATSTPSSYTNSAPTTLLASATQNDRFTSELTSLAPFLGPKPQSKDSPRKRALIPLIALSQSPAHLAQLVDVFAKWRAARRSVDEHTAEEFLGRCVNLGAPETALRVLADRPKYGVDIPSVGMARALLASLAQRAKSSSPAAAHEGEEAATTVTTSAFNDVLLLAALYPAYKLPEIYDDPVSLAIVLATCKSVTSDEARQIEADLIAVAKTSNAKRGEKVFEVKVTERELAWATEGRELVPYPINLLPGRSLDY